MVRIISLRNIFVNLLLGLTVLSIKPKNRSDYQEGHNYDIGPSSSHNVNPGENLPDTSTKNKEKESLPAFPDFEAEDIYKGSIFFFVIKEFERETDINGQFQTKIDPNKSPYYKFTKAPDDAHGLDLVPSNGIGGRPMLLVPADEPANAAQALLNPIEKTYYIQVLRRNNPHYIAMHLGIPARLVRNKLHATKFRALSCHIVPNIQAGFAITVRNGQKKLILVPPNQRKTDNITPVTVYSNFLNVQKSQKFIDDYMLVKEEPAYGELPGHFLEHVA